MIADRWGVPFLFMVATLAIGWQVAALLHIEAPVLDVTQGNPRENLRTVAILTIADGSINVWGYFSAGSAVMPECVRAVENDGLIDVYCVTS